MLPSRNTRRQFWLKIHLCLGLFAGAVFVLTGLTGSLLAFEHPLDEWLNAEQMTVSVPQPQDNSLSLDTIYSAGAKVLPAGGQIPANSNRP